MLIKWMTPMNGGFAQRCVIRSAAWLLLLTVFDVAHAHAADKPQVLVFSARSRETKAHKGEGAVTREVRSAIEHLEVGELLPAPALDLEAMQLTIDCVGETASCLGQVAKQSHARVLIVPSLERSGANTTLRILYFDAEKEAEPRTVQRNGKSKDIEAHVSDSIPEMLRELFPAAPESKEAKAEPEPEPTPDPAETGPVDDSPEPARHRAFPVGPVILGAAGLVAVGGGLVVGLAMNSTEDSYSSRKVQTAAEAMQVDEQRKTGKQQALIANVLIGAGAAALIAGVIWYAAGLSGESKPAPQAMLVPSVGSDGAGLALVGTWGDRL
jgi:hypothetical protein